MKNFVFLFLILATSLSAYSSQLNLACWDIKKSIDSNAPLSSADIVLTADVVMGTPSSSILRNVVYSGAKVSDRDLSGKYSTYGKAIESGYIFNLTNGSKLLLDASFKTNIYVYYSYLFTQDGHVHPNHPMGLKCVTRSTSRI